MLESVREAVERSAPLTQLPGDDAVRRCIRALERSFDCALLARFLPRTGHHNDVLCLSVCLAS